MCYIDTMKKMSPRPGLRSMRLAALCILFSVFASLLLPAQVLRPTVSSEEDRLIESIRQVFRFIQNKYVDEVDADELYEGALRGMFESLGDPYSAYLDVNDMRNLNDTTQGEFGGVGLYINKVVPEESRPEIGPWVEVVSPIEDTPAFRAGLHAGDYITAIDGNPVDALNIDEVVAILRGQPGSVVTVSIYRSRNLRFDVYLTRAIIEIPTVKHDTIGDYGFLRIIQFTPRTAERVEFALKELLSRQVKGLVIDVRSNPGGLLSSVVETADLFFEDGLIVGTRGRVSRENQAYNASPGALVPEELPIVLLIDGGSASAAEILAGALRNRDRAALVGTTTFGKGSVQQIRQLGDTGFRLTMSRYFTPGNIYIDKVGVPPDLEVTQPELSEEESLALVRITDERRIAAFFDRTANPGEQDVENFIRGLKADGINLPDRIVRRLVRLEKERRENTSSVYDLDYDVQLQEALRILREGRVQRLIDSRAPLDSDFAQASGLPIPRLP